MFIQLSYALCLQFITMNCLNATDTKYIEVNNVNKDVEIYNNRTIARDFIVQARNSSVSINKSQAVREDKKKVVSSFRDVEETFKRNSPLSTQRVNGVEWFGKDIKKAPPQRLRLARAAVMSRRIVATFGQDSSLNIVADFLIDMVHQQIVKHGQDQIKIPDIHERFHKGIGSFDAVNGWFRSLTSLRRTADVTVSRKGDILSVKVGMGLDSMVLGYENYNAKYLRVGPRGKIKGEVDHNLLVLELAVDITNADCKILLHKLYFKEFSKLKINLTGLGKLNWAFSKIVTWITDKFRGEIVHKAENILKENMEKMFSSFHCF